MAFSPAEAILPTAPNAEVCLTCHSVVVAKREPAGPAWVGWVLLPFYLLPGILYFVWRSRSRRPVCPRCDGTVLVPALSARGNEILAAAAAALPPSSGHRDCPSCMLPVIFPAGRRTIPCPHCTTNLTLTESGRIETD